MSALQSLQRELKNLLFIRPDEAPSSTLWPDGLPSRLSVYRHNVRANWTDALDHDFPLTRRQFPEPDWRALQARYFVRHPPKHWELNASMAPFCTFLSGQKIESYVKELADWEWHDLRVFIDRSVVRRGLGVSNPTVVVRVYRHQIFNWVEAGAPAERPPDAKPEVLVFYRDPRNACHVREADPLMLLFLEHFKKPGARLETLEADRRKLLPTNDVPLETVMNTLEADGLLLL